MGVQTTPHVIPIRTTPSPPSISVVAPTNNPLQDQAHIKVTPTAVVPPFSSLDSIQLALQNLLQKASSFQQSLANLSFEEILSHLSTKEQEVVHQFFTLLYQPFENLTFNKATEVTECFKAFEPLVSKLFDPDATQAFQQFMRALPYHITSIVQCHFETETTKARVNALKEVSISLDNAYIKSKAFIDQETLLTVEEAQREAQLATVRLKRHSSHKNKIN